MPKCTTCDKTFLVSKAARLSGTRKCWNCKMKTYGSGARSSVYKYLMWKQDGKCAICGKQYSSQYKLELDHCHKSKKVRGLLCKQCNLGLGMFKDDPRLFKLAIFYLYGR